MDLPKEDAVSFLARISEKFPHALALLNTSQAKLLSKDPAEPYQPENVNEEYLRDMACQRGVSSNSEEARLALSGALLGPRTQNKELNVEESLKKKEILDKVSVLYYWLNCCMLIGRHSGC